MKYEKCKVILVETREKNGTFKVSPSDKMYPCYMYSNTWFGFKFYHMMILLMKMVKKIASIDRFEPYKYYS